MKVIYSVGHSNHSMDYFLDLLAQSGIEILADIRSAPYSRFSPQYNQNSLRKSLQACRIEYVYLGDKLGGRIKDVTCYLEKELPQAKAGHALHLDYEVIREKDWFRSGIKKLEDFAQHGKTALLCSEENPAHCHRELIVGRMLREMGYEVVHIRKNEEKRNQPGLF